MAKNMIYKDANVLEIVVPAGITSGDPVVVNNITGVALTDRDATSGKATVKFNAVFDLSVKAINDDGNSAVAIGDIIFWLTGDTPKLSKKNSGTAFGIALETITEAETDTIKVMLMDIAALASIPANMITNAMMADDAIGLAELNANQKVRVISVILGLVGSTSSLTYSIYVALKACEVKSAVFITDTDDAVDETDFHTCEIINKGTDGAGAVVVATQNSDSNDGNQAFEAYKKWPLVVATDGKENIAADSVLCFIHTRDGAAEQLRNCVLVLELEVQDPA